MQLAEKVRQILGSTTARTVAKCIALCAVGSLKNGRITKADKGKSCCS